MPTDELTVVLVDVERRVLKAMSDLIDAAAGFRLVGVTSDLGEVSELASRSVSDVGIVYLHPTEIDRGLAFITALANWQIGVLALAPEGHLAQAARGAGAREFLDQGSDPEQILEFLRRIARRDNYTGAWPR